ncbi:hypothetical protein [Cerasicoccus frondis]|uniref:hypothetical protein n=1 Tax=Cerasicoccus frondis TaxID=490090 RepID=UPI002852B063|nr:hypothetical protein [Cerasicoccus frondis]
MTSLGLAQRILRHLIYKDWGEMPIEAHLEILDAINVALATYFSAAPENYRRISKSYLLSAPQTVTITTTNGSTALADTPFANQTRGAMVRVDGDDQWNRVDGDSALQSPYLGQSGDHQATIYSDVVELEFNDIERFITYPVLNNGRVLAPDNSMREHPGRFFRDLGDLASGIDYDIGSPRWHMIDYFNDLTAGRESQAGLLRVYPLPDQAYTLRVEAIVAPFRINLSALTTSIDLPVRNTHAERFLLPLVLGELANGALWKDPSTKSANIERGYQAERNLDTLQNNLIPSNNRVGTPEGY